MASGVVASAHLLNIIIAKVFSVRSRKTATSCLCSWSSSVSPPITGIHFETFRNATAPDRLEQLCSFDLSPTSSAVAIGTVLCCCCSSTDCSACYLYQRRDSNSWDSPVFRPITSLQCFFCCSAWRRRGFSCLCSWNSCVSRFMAYCNYNSTDPRFVAATVPYMHMLPASMSLLHTLSDDKNKKITIRIYSKSSSIARMYVINNSEVNQTTPTYYLAIRWYSIHCLNHCRSEVMYLSSNFF